MEIRLACSLVFLQAAALYNPSDARGMQAHHQEPGAQTSPAGRIRERLQTKAACVKATIGMCQHLIWQPRTHALAVWQTNERRRSTSQNHSVQ